ncbi:aminoglycoside phosphotransferase family protein [Thalassospira sp. UBA1131]|uniref:aminoglycoside phosphotransferase family protein n=1 Tax=Thalassospira sp. UBA1131 TaxID=1947672 RepID=UPI0025F0D7AA|nr:phosphotransferase [Thalassospira sp. UBA1131]
MNRASPDQERRNAERQDFLVTCGWQTAQVMPLVDDASARKYFRLERRHDTALLMDFPPTAIHVDPHGIHDNPERPASVSPVLQTTNLFQQAGWRVPEIYQADEKRGLVLIEDFGDITFTEALTGSAMLDGTTQDALYLRAIEQLITLHRFCDGGGMNDCGLVRYGPENLRRMLASFKADYLPLIIPDAAKRDAASTAFDQLLETVLPLCWQVGEVIIHRDYHVDNLMLVENGEGGDDCGIIDFQDAAIAPRPYDLTSLLRDVRHDIGPDLEARMKEFYLAAFPDIDRSDFETAYIATSMVRNFRILGRFGWLAIKAGKTRYFDYIPRCWEMILRGAAEKLPALQDWVDVHIPSDARRAPALAKTQNLSGEEEQS